MIEGRRPLPWLAIVLLGACGGAVRTEASAHTARSVPTTAPRSGDADLAAILERARVELALPGAAALVFDHGASRSAAVGFRSLASSEPLTTTDRFHLGSDGKAMTATLAARLIHDGVLPPWDTPLSAVFAGEEIHPALADVTLEDLASHRAGLPRDPEVDDTERAAILAVTDAVAQRELILHRELRRAPTTERGGFVYSNLGFMLLGVAIERAAGAPFEEVMRTRLFAPLGMSSCSFDVPSGGAPWGHAPDGSVAGASTAIPPAYGPVGGVHCTLDDWALFLADHVAGEHGGSSYLDAESYRALHRPPEGGGYAFGWNIALTSRGRQLTHAGSNGFWMAVALVELDMDRASLFATNIGDVDLDRVEVFVHELGGIPIEGHP